MIQSVHFINPANAGDMQSCPFEHFRVDAEVKKFHILDMEGLDADHPVIIGGGGLLQHGKSLDTIEVIIKSHLAPVIIWGAGVNTNNKKDQDHVPDFVQKASLVGIRDYTFMGFEYLPCVSCMSPLFDQTYQVEHEIVCYEGNELNLPYPTLSCQAGHSMEEIIAFLGSARTIVTSSYHGMYWGVLLGKEVIVIPNEGSSKFYNFPFHIPITTIDKWKFFVGKAEIHDDALKICRGHNQRFSKRVSDLLKIQLINKLNQNK